MFLGRGRGNFDDFEMKCNKKGRPYTIHISKVALLRNPLLLFDPAWTPPKIAVKNAILSDCKNVNGLTPHLLKGNERCHCTRSINSSLSCMNHIFGLLSLRLLYSLQYLMLREQFSKLFHLIPSSSFVLLKIQSNVVCPQPLFIKHLYFLLCS